MNPYLEDVFSLGLSFLQMVRLLKEADLLKYKLNDDTGSKKPAQD